MRTLSFKHKFPMIFQKRNHFFFNRYLHWFHYIHKHSVLSVYSFGDHDLTTIIKRYIPFVKEMIITYNLYPRPAVFTVQSTKPGVFDAVIRFLGEFGAVERNKDGKGCVSSWFYICFILRVDYDYFELSPSNDLCWFHFSISDGHNPDFSENNTQYTTCYVPSSEQYIVKQINKYYLPMFVYFNNIYFLKIL